MNSVTKSTVVNMDGQHVGTFLPTLSAKSAICPQPSDRWPVAGGHQHYLSSALSFRPSSWSFGRTSPLEPFVQMSASVRKVEFPNRRYKPGYNDWIYVRPGKEFACDDNCDCSLLHGWKGCEAWGGMGREFSLSNFVSLSSGRAELRELQPSEFWEAVGAYDVDADDLVYRVSDMKLYVGGREVRTQLGLSRAMELMGDNEEHQPLMDYIVVPEDTVFSGTPVTSMYDDATVVVSNILAEGYSKVLQLDETTEDLIVDEAAEGDTVSQV
ncbi:hypothetical protein [Phaffia rhodozyma]|uniref:Uncharacterized protein n=1 Tax=Phaffia rhodozyma TaxID=264483 RepID=A0A0F7SEZ8_PHARH|nr:hypothetical protein [Phaffia rhodozyma]